MGARKRIAAEARKEALKEISFARLTSCPTSPRKMRLMADLIRGKKTAEALSILRFSTKHASERLEKVLVSAIANFEAKNPGQKADDTFVKEVYIDSARILKRMRPAPQGRGYKIRKRSNHITLIIDSTSKNTETAEVSAN
ncbi:MAG: 50S ribosomal protein L22 [Bacteroidetes bacterium]|nr:50S ribosomal protein L22 [Bacteroidota bacterium]